MKNLKNKQKKPWDENLHGNARYIKKFYKKPEKDIKKMKGEGGMDKG